MNPHNKPDREGSAATAEGFPGTTVRGPFSGLDFLDTRFATIGRIRLLARSTFVSGRKAR